MDTITLAKLCSQLASGNFEFSRHAFRRVIERNIGETEIREAGGRGVLIEDYPDDKYAPSCLLLGFADAGRPLHMQVAYLEGAALKIITLYEPDVSEWYENYSKRRP